MNEAQDCALPWSRAEQTLPESQVIEKWVEFFEILIKIDAELREKAATAAMQAVRRD